MSLCSGRDTATESILPEDAPSHLMGIGAGGGVISVVCSLGELRTYGTEEIIHGNSTRAVVQFKMQARAGSSVNYIDYGANCASIALLTV